MKIIKTSLVVSLLALPLFASPNDQTDMPATDGSTPVQAAAPAAVDA